MVLNGELDLPSTQCVLRTNICATKGIPILRKFMAANNIPSNGDVISELKEYLGVSTEYDVWNHELIRAFVNDKVVNHIHKMYFKSPGPHSSTSLLSNVNIDNVLSQWAFHSDQLFGKKLKHIDFHMADFMHSNTELRRLDILEEVIKPGYKSMCIVFNTDVSSGPGKHWLCVYGDFAHAGTVEDPYVLEYFNSSGKAMMKSVNEWMIQHKKKLLEKGIYLDYIYPLLSKPIQKSRTECGMWSLIYIRSRLEGKSPTFLYDAKMDDIDMIRYRRYVFLVK